MISTGDDYENRPQGEPLISRETAEALGMKPGDKLPREEIVRQLLDSLTPQQVAELKELRHGLLRLAVGDIRDKGPLYPFLHGDSDEHEIDE